MKKDIKKDTKLALWLGENADYVKQYLRTSGILKLGGESRFVKYELKEGELLANYQNKWEGIKEAINQDKRFKLYIATTAMVKKFLFSWDNVHRNGSERLRRFLMEDLDIGWVKDAKILIFDVGKTIRIFKHEKKGENKVEIMLEEKKEEADLRIGDGGTLNLKVKKENGKLNVYAKKFTWDIKHVLKQKLGIEPVNIYPLIGKPDLISGWNYAHNRPKGNRYGIPEGSVYFVEFEGEFEWNKPYLKFGELNKLGYGLAFFAVWRGDNRIGGRANRNV